MQKNERSRQYEWDKRNLRTISTHVTVQEAEKFKEACNRKKVSPYHVVREYVLQYTKDNTPWYLGGNDFNA